MRDLNISVAQRLGSRPFDRIILAKLEDPSFHVQQLAEQLNLDRKSLYRKIKFETGSTPQQYLRNFRLNRSAELLANGKYTVSEVASKVGFQDVGYFSRCFKKLFTISPSDWTESADNTPFLDTVGKVLLANIESPRFSVGDLATELHMDRNTLYRKIKKQSGVSAQIYIRNLRICQGARLLRGNRMTVSEAAFKVGFTGVSYFSKCFKAYFAESPSEFISRFQNQTN